MRAEGPVLDTLAVAKAAISMQSSVVDQLMVAAISRPWTSTPTSRRSAPSTPRAARRDVRGDLPGAADGARDPARGRDVPVGLARRGCDAQEMLADAVAAGVAYLPGWSFYADNADRSDAPELRHLPAVIEDAVALGEVIPSHRA